MMSMMRIFMVMMVSVMIVGHLPIVFALKVPRWQVAR